MKNLYEIVGSEDAKLKWAITLCLKGHTCLKKLEGGGVGDLLKWKADITGQRWR